MSTRPPTTHLSPLQKHRAHARELVLRRRFDLAEPVIRQILSIVPDDADANRQLASCLFFRGRLDEALSHGMRAISLKPDSHSGYIVVGGIHSTRGDQELAIEMYSKAVELRPDSVFAYSGLADANGQLDRWTAVLDWSERGLALQPNHCELLRSRAYALAALGRSEESLRLVNEYLRLEPSSPSSLASAGNTYRLIGKIKEAEDFLLRALPLAPANPEIHKGLAWVKLKQERWEDSRYHFEAALALRPGMRAAVLGLQRLEVAPLWKEAQTLFGHAQYELAEPPLRRILEKAPAHPAASPLLARTLIRLHRYEEGLTQARAAVESHPKSAYARFVLGIALAEMEQNAAAMVEAAEAIRLKPDNPRFYALPAAIHLDREEFSEALGVAERGLVVAADNELLLRIRAVTWAGLGRREEALEAISGLLEANADKGWVYFSAGRVWGLLKEYEAAEEYYHRFLQVRPGEVGGIFRLGLLYFEQRLLSRARPLLEESLRLNPYLWRAREALAVIGTDAAEIAEPPAGS